jgi:hypothetical protein
MSLIDQLTAEYHSTGVVVIPGVLPESVCSTLVERVETLIAGEYSQWLDRTAQRYGEPGGILRHGLIDGLVIRKHLLEIQTLYHALHPLVGALTGQSIVSGLYPISDINMVVYQHGSVKGPHFDTVPVSLLLFLTSHPEDTNQGSLCYESLTGRTVEYFPRAGDIFLFQGRRVRHWVKAITAPLMRIVVNANYYTADDHSRDPGIDELLYSQSRERDRDAS